MPTLAVSEHEGGRKRRAVDVRRQLLEGGWREDIRSAMS